jgi:hypothetical protein
MKKLLFKVFLLAGLMLSVPYYLLGGGTVPGFIKDLFKAGKETAGVPMDVSSVTTDKEITFYKCTSESGQIEFSQSPCMGEGETIRLQPNVNVVQRTKIPDQEEEESGGPSVITLGSGDNENNKQDKQDKKEGELELGNPYDPNNIQKLIKDAQNVGKLMDQHSKQIDSTGSQQK